MRHVGRPSRRSAIRALLLGVVALAMGTAASGCVDEKIVYRDAPRFTPPVAAAASFLGYRDTTAKATVCGSCHIGPQGEWARTQHASAWATLASNPGRQAFCEGCHSVNAFGNASTTAQSGWTSTKDLRYKDVQCESCHGPGLEHVSNPNSANIPLATLKADTTMTDGCGECHSGEHHPFVAEWQRSPHYTMSQWSATGPNTRPECQACHTGQGALQAMGVNARTNYKEKNTVATDPLRITCGVCHDPHAAEVRTVGGQQVRVAGQLRLPIDQPDEQRNLCMSCHHKRGEPDLGTGGTTTRGAHSPEGPMLLGEAGWWPPGMEVPGGLERIETSHGSERNPRLCAGCHVERYAVTDKLTNQLVMNVTGHRFLATPCVDAQGLPTENQDCGENLTQRRFTACATSGCHASENQARSAFAVAETRIATLNTQLKALLAAPAAAADINRNDTRFTMAEGAQFNTTLADKTGSWVHNPFLMEALLTASIQGVRTTYGLPLASSVSLRNTMLERLVQRAPAPAPATMARVAARSARTAAPPTATPSAARRVAPAAGGR